MGETTSGQGLPSTAGERKIKVPSKAAFEKQATPELLTVAKRHKRP